MDNSQIIQWEKTIIDGLKNKQPLHITLSKINLKEYTIGIKRNIFPQEAIIKTYIYARTRRISFKRAVTEINNSPEILESLGYNKDENDKWIKPTVSTLRHYKKKYEFNVEIIKLIELFKKHLIQLIDDNKKLRTNKEKELAKKVKEILIDAIKEHRHHNHKNPINKILDTINDVAVEMSYINNNTEYYNKYEPEKENPPAREVRYFIKTLYQDKDIIKMFNELYKQNF